MCQLLWEDVAQPFTPRANAWVADIPRTPARAVPRTVVSRAEVSPQLRPLRAYHARRYSPDRYPALFGALAVAASVLIFAITVALPCVIEAGTHATRALVHDPARIADVAALQRDTLLAGASWPYTHAVAGAR